MTLVAAFRCRSGGILLCADREENDGISKRAVEKIYRVRRERGSIFIAGAGPAGIISKFHEAVERAVDESVDLMTEHTRLIEESLESVYSKYVKSEYDRIATAIVLAFNIPNSRPLLYGTEGTMLLSGDPYVSAGSGKPIADYLVDRLYQPTMDKATVGCVAGFVLREAEESTHGVGLGADMLFIHPRDRTLEHIGPDLVKELQDRIPKLGEVIWPHWTANVTVPSWLSE